MTADDMIAFAHRWAAAVATDRADAFDDLAAPPLRAACVARAAAVRAGLAGLAVTVDEVVVDRDRIAWRWTARGVHAGPLLGVAATGAPVALAGVNFQRVVDGRAVEHWTLADADGARAQLSR